MNPVLFESVPVARVGRPVHVTLYLEIEGQIDCRVTAGSVIEGVLVIFLLQGVAGGIVTNIPVYAQIQIRGAEAETYVRIKSRR